PPAGPDAGARRGSRRGRARAMTFALDAVFASLAGAYAVRWFPLRKRDPSRGWRSAAVLAGLAVLWGAVASPLSGSVRGHLTGHMIQHLLIMTVAAPLILLGEPLQVFFHG